jgi:hypothetical protein
LRIEGQSPDFGDDKQKYKSKIIVVAIGAAYFSIDGLMSLSSHIICQKTKNQLHNTDHKVAEGIYVQELLRDGEAFSIAASGAAVANILLFGITVFRLHIVDKFDLIIQIMLVLPFL